MSPGFAARFQASLNAQTEGCVSRRDLRLTTAHQGEQGRGRRHVPELHPPSHRVCNHRCTGSIRAQESFPRPSGLQRHGHPGNLVIGCGAVTAAMGHDHAVARDVISCRFAPRPRASPYVPLYPFSALVGSRLSCHRGTALTWPDASCLMDLSSGFSRRSVISLNCRGDDRCELSPDDQPGDGLVVTQGVRWRG